MGIGEIVLAIIVGLISMTLLIYSYFTSRKKGPILSNTYIFATPKERKKIDRDAEYRMVTVVYGTLGLIFLLLSINIIFVWSWLFYIIGILVLFVISYAIVESIKTLKKDNSMLH